MAAGLPPARLGPPRADPAVGVRVDPDRVGRAAARRSSTSCGCRQSTCADMYLDAGARRRPRRTSFPTVSTCRTSRPTVRRWSSTARAGDGVRFLFVGGAIARKGIDLLLSRLWRGVRRARRRDADRQGLRRRRRLPRRRPRRAAAHGGGCARPARACTSPRRSPTTRSPRSTAPATCSSIPTAARASRCRSSRPWPAACRSIVTAGGPTDEFCPAAGRLADPVGQGAGARAPDRRSAAGRRGLDARARPRRAGRAAARGRRCRRRRARTPRRCCPRRRRDAGLGRCRRTLRGADSRAERPPRAHRAGPRRRPRPRRRDPPAPARRPGLPRPRRARRAAAAPGPPPHPPARPAR